MFTYILLSLFFNFPEFPGIISFPENYREIPGIQEISFKVETLARPVTQSTTHCGGNTVNHYAISITALLIGGLAVGRMPRSNISYALPKDIIGFP